MVPPCRCVRILEPARHIKQSTPYHSQSPNLSSTFWYAWNAAAISQVWPNCWKPLFYYQVLWTKLPLRATRCWWLSSKLSKVWTLEIAQKVSWKLFSEVAYPRCGHVFFLAGAWGNFIEIHTCPWVQSRKFWMQLRSGFLLSHLMLKELQHRGAHPLLAILLRCLRQRVVMVVCSLRTQPCLFLTQVFSLDAKLGTGDASWQLEQIYRVCNRWCYLDDLYQFI